MKFHLFGSALLFSLMASNLSAQSALDSPCVPDTLADYLTSFSGSAGCSIGIQNFNDFMYSSAGSATSRYTANQIEVTPAIGGFTFSLVNDTPFMVAQGLTAEYFIQYNFVIDPLPVGDAADLGMDPPFGNVGINQYYCADSMIVMPDSAPTCNIIGANSFAPQVLHVDDTHPPASWVTGLVPLNPPALNSADVLTLISLDGTNGAAGFDMVTGDSYLGPATPEPQTIFLLAGGLLVTLFRKRLPHVSS